MSIIDWEKLEMRKANWEKIYWIVVLTVAFVIPMGIMAWRIALYILK